MSDRTDRTDCSASARLVNAYHEAGHAIVDYAVWPPNPVDVVTIEPTAEHIGFVRLRKREQAWRLGLSDDLAEAYLAEANTVGDLAGNVAVAIFLGSEEELPLPPLGSGDHYNALANALRTWDGVDGLVLQPRDYLERTREVLQRPDVRLAIVRTASALLRQRALSGVEVEAIVNQSGVTCEHSEVPLGWDDRDEDAEGEAFSWSRW